MLGGYVIATMAPVLFYIYIFSVMKKSNVFYEIKTFTKMDWIVSLFTLLGITGAIFVLIRQNQFVYYWDYGREWTTAINLSKDLFESPMNTVKSIYSSINTTDYNRFMPILIVLPLKILGSSFARYVAINHVFYMCPALLVISLLIYKVLKKYSIQKAHFWNVLLLVATTPILYYVLLDGFMDPPILLLMSGVLLLTMDFDFQKVDISRCLLITVGLLLLVLFRRHFAYWVVGYIFSVFYIAIYQFINNKDQRKKIFKNYVIDMLIIGGTSLVILLTVFNQFFMRSVFNNFSYAYDAWDASYADKFTRIVIVFGWGILFMVFILAPAMCKFIKGISVVVVSSYINISIATVLLWRELQMNWHQYYLIVIQIIVLACIGLFGIAERLNKKKATVMVALGTMCGIINLIVCFVPMLNGVNLLNIFSTRFYEAKVRHDMNEINQLIDYINELSNTNNGKMVYVLSSSVTLNSDTLRKARLPHDNNPVPYLYETKNVDLRDGFPVELFYADVLVVGDPIQIHCPEETQQIITYFTELILDSNSYLGRHYDYVNRFELDGGVVAKVYLRNSHYEKEDYQKLQQHFDEIYGEYPELFHDLIVYPEAFFPDKVGETLKLTGVDEVLGTNCAESRDNFVSTGQGHLVYGPGKRIEKGVYNVVFHYDYEGAVESKEALGVVDVCLSRSVVVSSDFYAGEKQVSLDHIKIDDADDLCEVRMYVNVPGVEFKSVTIEKVE